MIMDPEVDALVGRPLVFNCPSQHHENFRRDQEVIKQIQKLEGEKRYEVNNYYRFLETCILLSKGGPHKCPKRTDYWYHRAEIADSLLRKKLKEVIGS